MLASFINVRANICLRTLSAKGLYNRLQNSSFMGKKSLLMFRNNHFNFFAKNQSIELDIMRKHINDIWTKSF